MILTKEDILNAFEEIVGIAKERNIVVDIGVYGGHCPCRWSNDT